MRCRVAGQENSQPGSQQRIDSYRKWIWGLSWSGNLYIGPCVPITILSLSSKICVPLRDLSQKLASRKGFRGLRTNSRTLSQNFLSDVHTNSGPFTALLSSCGAPRRYVLTMGLLHFLPLARPCAYQQRVFTAHSVSCKDLEIPHTRPRTAV